jgi:hypothetical protein
MLQNAFGYFSFIKLISNFQNMYTKYIENNITWKQFNLEFFSFFENVRYTKPNTSFNYLCGR